MAEGDVTKSGIRKGQTTPKGPKERRVRTFFDDPDTLDDPAEADALRKREKELKPVLPRSAKEMVEATIGSAGQGSINELQIRFAYNERIAQILHDIEGRLERFLGTDTPSAYAEALFSSVTSKDTPAQAQKIVQEIQTYIVGELNPLLQELHRAIQEEAGANDPLQTEVELSKALALGKIRNQKTFSAFSLIQKFGTDYKLPTIDLETPQFTQNIVVADPLTGSDVEAYWQDRRKAHEVYGEATLPDLIRQRSQMAAYELEQAAERIPGIEHILDRADAADDDLSPEEERALEAYDAYIELASWIETKAAPFQGTISPEEMAYRRSLLHFAHGAPKDVFAILNAAEKVKQSNPELFMRLAGISPGRNYAIREAGRSDLFGSVFHMALHRSLHLDAGKENIGYAVFADRVKGLTELQRIQRDLLYISDTQMEELEKGLEQFGASMTREPDTSIVPAIMSTVLGQYYAEGALRKMLETVAVEQREQTLQTLRQATPGEFFREIEALPDFMLDDEDVLSVIEERFKYDPWIDSYHDLSEIPHAIRGKMEMAQNDSRWENPDRIMDAKKWLEEKGGYLFQTTPSEKLLCPEYFRFLTSISQQIGIDRAQKYFFPKKEQKERITRGYLEVVEAHPDISKRQWQEWRSRIMEQNRELPASDIMGGLDNTVQNIFRGRPQPFDEVLREIEKTIDTGQDRVYRTHKLVPLDRIIDYEIRNERAAIAHRLDQKNISLEERKELTDKFVDVCLSYFYQSRSLDEFIADNNDLVYFFGTEDERAERSAILNKILSRLGWADRSELLAAYISKFDESVFTRNSTHSYYQHTGFNREHFSNLDLEAIFKDMPKEGVTKIINAFIKRVSVNDMSNPLLNGTQRGENLVIYFDEANPWELKLLNHAEAIGVDSELYREAKTKKIRDGLSIGEYLEFQEVDYKIKGEWIKVTKYVGRDLKEVGEYRFSLLENGHTNREWTDYDQVK